MHNILDLHDIGFGGKDSLWTFAITSSQLVETICQTPCKGPLSSTILRQAIVEANKQVQEVAVVQSSKKPHTDSRVCSHLNLPVVSWLDTTIQCSTGVAFTKRSHTNCPRSWRFVVKIFSHNVHMQKSHLYMQIAVLQNLILTKFFACMVIITIADYRRYLI